MMSDRVGSMTSVGSRVGFRGMKGAGVGGGEKRWITMSVVRGMDFTRRGVFTTKKRLGDGIADRI